MNFDKLKKHSHNNLGAGTDPKKIEDLEMLWGIRFPEQFRSYLEVIGYAEIYGDEIYSIYEVPDEIPCLGLHWMNKDNDHLKSGFIRFFSNDIDGIFFINTITGKIYLNSINNEFAESFLAFINSLLNEP